MSIRVTSSDFTDDGTIPTSAAYGAAGGDNVSPALSWTGVPDGASSIVVTCHDPDAPTTVGFTHWVLFNVDPRVNGLAAGDGAPGKAPGTHGITDWGEQQWGGMAPPPGDDPHHYVFTVTALDTMLDLDENTTYPKLKFMMGGHVLAEGSITGRFGLPGHAGPSPE